MKDFNENVEGRNKWKETEWRNIDDIMKMNEMKMNKWMKKEKGRRYEKDERNEEEEKTEKDSEIMSMNEGEMKSRKWKMMRQRKSQKKWRRKYQMNTMKSEESDEERNEEGNISMAKDEIWIRKGESSHRNKK